ncbi:unnamed protein product, partial [Prorocentrum cordatum]
GMTSPTSRHRGPEDDLFRMHEKAGQSASSHAAALLRQSPQLPERHPPPPRGASPTLPVRQPAHGGAASPQLPMRELSGQLSPYLPTRQPADGLGGGSQGGCSPAAPSAPSAFSAAAHRGSRSPTAALARGTPQMPMRHPAGTPQPAMRQPTVGTPQPSMRQPTGTPSMPTRLPAAAGTPQLPERCPRGASPCAVDRAGLGPLVEEDPGRPQAPAGSSDAFGAGFADAASEAAKAWLERLRGPSCTAEEGAPAQAEDPFDPPKKPTDVHRRESGVGDLSHVHHPLSFKEQARGRGRRRRAATGRLPAARPREEPVRGVSAAASEGPRAGGRKLVDGEGCKPAPAGPLPGDAAG